MENRMMFTRRRFTQDVRSPDSDPGDLIRAEDAHAGLSEAWRVWEAATSSRYFRGLVSMTRRTPGAVTPASLEKWIYFQDHASELDSRARATLHRMIPLLQANPTVRIVIGGVASQPGTVAYGMRLGLRRVLSIRSCLTAHGIDPNRVGIAIRGVGWFLAEGSGESDEFSEFRLQVTDPRWVLASN